MKIGILNSDTVELSGASAFGQYPDMFAKVFWALDASIEFKTYEVQFENYPLNIDDCDAYLITGSKVSAYEDKKWIKALKEYIKTLHANKKKLLGICFGHQIIAEALGGSVKKATGGWHVGVDSLSLYKEKFKFKTDSNKYNLIFSHQDEVRKLPKDSKLIAGSKACPNGMYVIGNHIMCSQGHIELDREFTRLIYDFRKDQIGELKYLNACKSLTSSTDEHDFVRDLIEFLKS